MNDIVTSLFGAMFGALFGTIFGSFFGLSYMIKKFESMKPEDFQDLLIHDDDEDEEKNWN